MNTELLPERVKKAVQDRITAGLYRTLVVGIVSNGKSEVFPFGKLEDGREPDGDTVYGIGSITKTFTATILAEAVLSKRVTLDTPVAELLPKFKIPERNGKKITLGDIGMHRSGLPRMPSNMDKNSANPYAAYDARDLKTFIESYRLSRSPGECFEYSNLAFALLGHALAEQARVSYATMLNESVFRPLGMTLSGIEFTEKMLTNMAVGHDEIGNLAPNMTLDAMAGAGGISSSANDLVRYLKANMGVDQTPLTEAMKFARKPRADTIDNKRIGLAWVRTDQDIVFHNGATGGYRSFLGFKADGSRGVVILTNTLADVDDLGFATMLDDAPLSAVYEEVALPSDSLPEYFGAYKLTGDFVISVFRVGEKLCVQRPGREGFQIFASAPNEFFARFPNLSISFTRNEGGEVNGLVLHQNGDHFAPKLSAEEIPMQHDSG